MKKLAITQNFIALIIILLSAYVVVTRFPSVEAKPTGIFLPMTKSLTQHHSSKVKLYSNFPSKYRPLGQVHVETHDKNPTHQGATATLNMAREIAAKSGANGLVIQTMVHLGDKDYPQLARYFFQGMAIKTK